MSKHFDGFTEDWLTDYKRHHGCSFTRPDPEPEGVSLLNPAPPKPKEPVIDAYQGSEKDFQPVAEEWLIFNGYHRRTKKNIANPACKWWFLHYPNEHAKSNPLVLDLILLREGHNKEIELKVQGGKIKPHQAQLIERGGAIAWNLRDLAAIVRAWEKEIENNKGVK